jgi:hypothetical protein
LQELLNIDFHGKKRKGKTLNPIRNFTLKLDGQSGKIAKPRLLYVLLHFINTAVTNTGEMQELENLIQSNGKMASNTHFAKRIIDDPTPTSTAMSQWENHVSDLPSDFL